MTATTRTHHHDDSQQTTGWRRLRLMGTRPAPQVTSYGDVPWYRKAEFILFPLLVPLLIVVAITGDIFFKATRTTRKYSDVSVWRYTLVSKVFFVTVDVIFLATVISLVI